MNGSSGITPTAGEVFTPGQVPWSALMTGCQSIRERSAVGVPFTNNLAEQALRMSKIRHVSLQQRQVSQHVVLGAEAAEGFFVVLAHDGEGVHDVGRIVGV